MNFTINTYNERGGRVFRHTVPPYKVAPEVFDTAERFAYVAGFAIDGVGIFTVGRRDDDLWLTGMLDGKFAAITQAQLEDRVMEAHARYS